MKEPQVELAARKCKPCQGIPPMSELDVKALVAQVKDWKLEGNSITKSYRFKDFKESMKFVNQVADLAEEEGHHPDIFISWNKVALTLLTHVIGGLSENDFILAAKIDKIE